MEGRCISGATLKLFRIGQIGDSEKLFTSGLEIFGRDRLVRCGIAAPHGATRHLVFPTNFLLFPFISRGTVVYLQARSIDAGSKRRWICPSALPPSVFNMDVLLGVSPTVTICEGITDTLSAHELGISAIGLLGAGADLTSEVVSLLKERNVAVVGDADSAGYRFSRRISEDLSSRGITVIEKHLPR